MNVMPFQSGEIVAPGIAIHQIDERIDSAEAWSEYAAGLQVVSVIGESYHHMGQAYEKRRSPGEPRYVWAGDHFWHLDLMREGPEVGKLVTAIYYAAGNEMAPGTEILDTSLFFQEINSTGFFQELNIEPSVLSRLQAVFTEGNYYREALPAAATLGTEEEREQIHDFLSNLSINDTPATNLEYADYLESIHPKSILPLLLPNPFSADQTNGLAFDGGERCADILDPRTGASYRGMLDALRAYLFSAEGELREKGIIHTVRPVPGTAVFFTREGTAHRALPGNEAERKIYTTWLATNPSTITF